MNLDEVLKQVVEESVRQAESAFTPDMQEYTPDSLNAGEPFEIGVDGNGNGHSSFSVQRILIPVKKT